MLNTYQNLGAAAEPRLAWDLFYIDASVSGSLVRVTDTETTTEFPK